MELKVYNQKGAEAGNLTLDEKLYGLKWNADMIHQVIVGMQSNARFNTAHVKGRGEVRGGGKKPWRQKGTGQARHGSTRSPIWIGGGVTHGPSNERNYDKKINRKMKTKALFTILSEKIRNNQLMLVDSFVTAKPSTKEATSSVAAWAKMPGFEKIAYKSGRRALIITPAKDEALLKSFANLKAVKVEEAASINPLLTATYNCVIVVNPSKALPVLEARKK
jgi:large subunit ribosomal protein L4